MIEEGFEHKEIGLRGFYFNLFNEERELCVGDNVKELLYLSILMNLWPGDWEEQIY